MAEAPDAAMEVEPAPPQETNGGAQETEGEAKPEETNGGAQETEGEAKPEAPKKQRGKPKDALAPKKPLNAYQRISGKKRQDMKAAEDPRCKDLAAMGIALKEAYEATSEEEKLAMTKEYEAEIEIWRPAWAAYKQTDAYKDFFELKQDYIDIRQKKKMIKGLAKSENPPPKRPKSGYMLFAGEIRERVQKEVFDAGGGMGDIGVKISQEWQLVSETRKAEYGEQSARIKEKFDIEFAEYRKTGHWKKFLEDKARLEGKQTLKKLGRTKFREAPKKASSPYALYRSEVMPKIAEECKVTPMTTAEQGKKVAGMWAALPEEEKKVYQDTAARQKEEYEEKMLDFKKAQDYTAFLEERFKTKAKENKQVNMIDMPKRPKSVFAMYAEEHKKEVEPGKGEGKGAHALKKKFAEASEEEKAQLAEKEKELKEQWAKEMTEWKESDKFKGFLKTNEKIKTEFMNEAMKVMTIKFLNRAPAQPPKTGFAVFLHEKRAADEEASGQRSSKKVKREELTKYKEEWVKLDKVTRGEYDGQKKEKYKQWQDVVKEYMAKEEWKEYVTEAKRLKLPVQSLLSQKKMVLKTLKNGMKNVPLPEKPIDFPTKPPEAFRLFANEKKGQIPTAEMSAEFQKLDEEAKKKYTDEAEELMKKYVEELKAFKGSDEGGAYFRKYRQAQRLKNVTLAKFKYLKEMPKKPSGPLKSFMVSNLAAVKAQNPELKGFDIKKALEEKWKTLEESAREAFMAQHEAGQKAYNDAVAEFKASDNWKAFTKAVKVRKVATKSKTGGKSAAPRPTAPPRPDSYPVKPSDAVTQFLKEHAGAGKAKADLAKEFRELEEEAKGSRIREAQERLAQYNEAMEEWSKSEEGSKYLKSVKIFETRKRMSFAKSRFLKNEPKKPQTAYFLYTGEKRSEVARDFPDLKGLGPVQQKLTEMWKGLGEEEKAEFTKKEAVAKEAYQAALAEFHDSPDYKKFLAATKTRSSGGKGKGKGKGKASASKKAPAIVMPTAPEGMPKKPPSSMIIFAQEIGMPPIPASKKWVELGAEGQLPYQEKAKERNVEYETEMKAFMKTGEWKKYDRLKHAAEKRGRLQKAKERFLAGAGDGPKEPKRPQSAYFFFAAEKRPSVAGKSFAESAKEINTLWGALTPEEKKVYEDRYEEAKGKYDEEVKEYHASAGYKQYEKAVKQISATKRPAPAAAKSAAKAGKAGKAAKAGKAGRGRGGRGRGRGGAGRGAAAAKAKAGSDSDSDVMGSDSDDSSSSGSDSD